MKFNKILKFAINDTRKQRSRLFIFSLAISLGVATVVAIGSLRLDLVDQINSEAKEILGADIALKGYFSIPDSILAPFAEIAEASAQEKSLASMVRSGDRARLINVRAVDSNFPLYGEVSILQGEGINSIAQGDQVLISQNLSIQMNSKVGDQLKIGTLFFTVSGIYEKGPGQSGIAATVAPGLYISMESLTKTGLVSIGSRVRYSYYYKMDDEKLLESIIKQSEPAVVASGNRLETVKTSQQRLNRAYSNLLRFLNVIGFISLILGSIAISAAISLYLDSKKHTAAILKCLGLSLKDLLKVYFIQILYVSIIGSLVGVLLGVGLQSVISDVSSDFLAVALPVEIRFEVLSVGFLIGVLITLSISWASIRRLSGVSEISLLRSQEQDKIIDANLILGYTGLFIILCAASWWLMESIKLSLIYMSSLIVVILLFAGAAKLLIKGVDKIGHLLPSFEWKQGLRGVQRQGGQTTLLILATGLSLFLVLTLSFLQTSVLRNLSLSEEAGRSNMVVFDVTEKQREEMAAILQQDNIVVEEEIALVPMRLLELQGRSVFEWKKDSTSEVPDHIFDREYRVNSNDALSSNETLEAGQWPAISNNPDVVPISLEYFTAKQMGVDIGDRMVFNIYGSRYVTEVAAIRRVDFSQFRTSFTIVFPEGVLDGAPKSIAFVCQSPSKEAFAKAQNSLLDKYSNVSIIDLETIKETLTEVLNKVRFAINFMASLSFLTAIIVLVITIYLTRFQRIKEAVLLRTIGILGSQLQRINFYEFFILGLMAVLVGTILSFVAAWIISTWVFQLPFNPQFESVLWIIPSTLAVVTLIGTYGNRSILKVPPLEILRQEAG